jgi:hypothetical protein
VDACANIHTNASGTDGNTCTHIYATYIYPYTHTDTHAHSYTDTHPGAQGLESGGGNRALGGL